MLDLAPPASLILPEHWQGNRPAIIRPGDDILAQQRRALRSLGMLPGMTPVIGGKTKRYSFRGRQFSSGAPGTTTKTFTAADIGAAATDRVVVVFVDATNSAAPGSISVTIGGNAATQAAFVTSASTVTTCGIYYRAVSAGTTANIVVTSTFGTYGFAISVYALYGLQSATPTATTSTASPLSLNRNTSPGSIIIANQSQSNNNRTWTGVTEDANGSNGNYTGSCASAQATAAETPRTISCSMSPSGVPSGACAVWT